MSGKVIPLRPHPAASPRAWKGAESTALLSGWPRGTHPIDGDIRYGLRALRARTREMAQDSDHVRQFLRMCKTNVIGKSGIQLRSKVRLRNGKPDQRAQAAITEGWQEWGEKGVCDVTGQLSWLRIQLLAIETAAKDGEVFLRCIPGWEENRFAFAVQLLDSEAVDVDYNEELSNGNQVVMGVELNEWRRPVAFYVNSEQVMPWHTSYSRAERTRVPASQIIHAYVPEWIWQTRGIPWIATPLLRLKMLDGYEDAVITASRAAASKMGFYEQDPEAAAEAQLPGQRNKAGDLVKQAVPGGMEELPSGYKVSTVDWNWPNAEHASFEKAVLRNIGTGLGVNYNTWANDLEGVNLSSLRHGMQPERDIWRLIQGWVVGDLCTPVFRRWLKFALISGALRVNGRELDPLREMDYRVAGWRPRGWAPADPQKDAEADERNLRMRTKSVSQILRDRGDDPAEVWEELAEDITRLEELGIPLQLDGAPGSDTDERTAADDEELEDEDA